VEKIDTSSLIGEVVVCTRIMSPKSTRKSARPSPAAAPQVESEAPVDRDVKPLTVNVPTSVLHRAKTRATLAGTTMSTVVTDALTVYADGLGKVLGDLGYVERK